MTTPHYDLLLGEDPDPMNDVDSYLNDNWTAIENIPLALSGSSLPITNFAYGIGDRFYHTGLKSMFVLIDQDANWGNFWRPVQIRYGPWIAVPSTVLVDAVNYAVNDLQYRISNTGIIYWRGGPSTSLGTGYPNFTGTSINLLQPLPSRIWPFRTIVVSPAVYFVTSAPASPVMTRIAFMSTGVISVVVWNPAAAPTTNKLDFSSAQWMIGQTLGYGF